MSNTQNKGAAQPPQERIKNFSEVEMGYTESQAVNEARRCLNCKHKPCVNGCPVMIDIPSFIKEIVLGDYEKAYQIIAKSSSLPAVCGRVCPQESQCESLCVRGKKGESVAIGKLERFVADYHLSNNNESVVRAANNNHKVAIIGSGPSGLTCAGDLAKLGYQVTVFEALHTAGGVMVYGIPEFRLPKEIVSKEIANLKRLGVDIQTNIVVGRTYTIDQLFERGFEAVFIGSGAGLPKFLGIAGENYNGVYSSNEFLTRVNLMKAYKKDSETPIQRANTVAVIGGGNVAMDSARSAKRLGAETVYIVYRRSESELPARIEEVHHAKEEGIIFKMLTNPIEIIGDENYAVKGIRCREMTLGEPDETGRRSAVEKIGSDFILDVEEVILSIGTSPNPLIKNTTEGLQVQKWGGIIVDEDGKTSREGVYAGGDAVSGAATVILAMGAGKKAAAAIDKYIREK